MSPDRVSALVSSGLRFIRFGLVGALATGTYAVAVLALVRWPGLGPTMASVVAYIIATPVSYFGQRNFTFASEGSLHRELPRFLVVQVINLAAAAVVMWIVSEQLGADPAIGVVAVVMVIPLMTYILLNQSVFNHGKPAA